MGLKLAQEQPERVADAGLDLDESTEARQRIAQIEALLVELRSGWLRGASCEDWLVEAALANTLVSEIEAELEIVDGILGPQTFSLVVAPFNRPARYLCARHNLYAEFFHAPVVLQDLRRVTQRR